MSLVKRYWAEFLGEKVGVKQITEYLKLKVEERVCFGGEFLLERNYTENGKAY